jgi:hypothetical protein
MQRFNKLLFGLELQAFFKVEKNTNEMAKQKPPQHVTAKVAFPAGGR